MANRFFRRPVEGSDENSWAQYNDAHILEAIGECNVKLYNDAGALKVSKGRIGINDGTHEGVCIIDTVTTISLVPVTNNNWAEIYMTVSGPNVTFTAIDTDTGNDIYWDVIPTDFINNYNFEKGGYYINAARRCIGLVKKDVAGNLESIINCLNNSEGYNGYSYYDSNEDKKLIWQANKDSYKNWGEFQIGDWNMDSTLSVTVDHNLNNMMKIRGVQIFIRNDANDTLYPIFYDSNIDNPQGTFLIGSTTFALYRLGGGFFDSVSFDSTSYNRGWIWVDLAE